MLKRLGRWTRGDSSSSMITHVADVCERAANGDLEARLTGLPSDGETGRLCRAINHLLDVADAYVRESAAAMEHANHGEFYRPILLLGLPGAYRHGAVVINRGALQMRDRTEDVARAQSKQTRMVEEVARTTETVASACSELSATTDQISTKTSQAACLTRRSVVEATSAAELVVSQQRSAESIQSVVTLISEIARQTNLLAINAAIEAAHAGTVGAGFAVVANEVKVLSQNTEGAVEQIRNQVEAMQDLSRKMSDAVMGIANLVREIDRTTEAVSSSVREQIEATRCIAEQVSCVTQSIQEIASRTDTVAP